MPSLRCPVCRADNTQPPQCRRCRADLTLLFNLEEYRAHALATARKCAEMSQFSLAVAWARRADLLRRDGESCQLLAVMRLLAGDYCRAFQAAAAAEAIASQS